MQQNRQKTAVYLTPSKQDSEPAKPIWIGSPFSENRDPNSGDNYAEKRYILVLDMDETLLHFDPRRRSYFSRPYVHDFLRDMSKYYELVVFTAGLREYANILLDDFDKEGLITRRLFREHCTFRRGVYLKDLTKVSRDLTRIVIVDNLPDNYQLQQENGIPIKTWMNDNPHDSELPRLGHILRDFAEQ